MDHDRKEETIERMAIISDLILVVVHFLLIMREKVRGEKTTTMTMCATMVVVHCDQGQC